MSGFPLAGLLALREREEATARLALARALAEEDVLGAAREAAVRRVEAHRAWLEREAGAPLVCAGLVAAGLRERAAFAARLRRDVAALEGLVRDAEEATRAAEAETGNRRAALAAARGAVRSLERHRDRWRGERERARERREEAAAEDLVSARRAEP